MQVMRVLISCHIHYANDISYIKEINFHTREKEREREKEKERKGGGMITCLINERESLADNIFLQR